VAHFITFCALSEAKGMIIKMKIAINASILDDKPSGLGIYTYNVINELTKIISNNDELVIYTSNPEILKKNKNIKMKRVPQSTQPKYGKHAAIKRFIWSQYTLLKDLKKEKVDILYSPTQHGLLFYNIQIITIHDLLPIYFNYKKSLQRKLQNLYYRYLLPIVLKKVGKVITVSESTKKDIIKYYNVKAENIVRVYNGINTNYLNYKENAVDYIFQKYKVKNYLLSIGASYPYKNYDTLIKALKLIYAKDIKLVIAGGKNDYRNYLKLLSSNLGLSDKVIFIDYIPQEDLPYLYSAAQCLVYPSLYEGFGLPPLEAMACGCPVITSNTSSLPEVVGNAGIMVDPYDVNEIAKAIDLILFNENLRNEMIEKGLKQAKKFSWKKTAEEIYEVIKEIGERK
jgi:glycosyltransferase involved in cell wall biosynthesis